MATFRRDAGYSDGRHPDSVTFSTAQEDASRRDFTINGLFYDPVEGRVIDFVGGQEDLARRVIRAIGDPHERFAEDKLRLLRAVRFSATFDFTLDADTLAAIRQMAGQITVVSPERIATEMRQMLVVPRRSMAVRLAVETGLASAILPEIVPSDEPEGRRLDDTLAVLDRLRQPGFPLALAALLVPVVGRAGARKVCKRWRLSNQETDRVGWLVEHHAALERARSSPWSRVQKILIAEGIEDLLALNEAAAGAGGVEAGEITWCREKLSQPRDVLDPPPLLTGDDLIEHGVARGPVYRMLLDRVRDAQLDAEIHTKPQALALVDRLLEQEHRSKE